MDNHFASNAFSLRAGSHTQTHHKYQFVASAPCPESFHSISSIILLGCCWLGRPKKEQPRPVSHSKSSFIVVGLRSLRDVFDANTKRRTAMNQPHKHTKRARHTHMIRGNEAEERQPINLSVLIKRHHETNKKKTEKKRKVNRVEFMNKVREGWGDNAFWLCVPSPTAMRCGTVMPNNKHCQSFDFKFRNGIDE